MIKTVWPSCSSVPTTRLSKWTTSSSDLDRSVYEKSDPIQLAAIMLNGIFTTRFSRGVNTHMSSPRLSVASPALLAGSTNRTSASLSPRVQIRITDVRSKAGRWTVMATSA